MRTQRKRGVAFLAAWMIFYPLRIFSQEPNELPNPADSPATPDEQYSFAIEIEVVTVPVTVTDPAGEFVTNLNKGDFRVFDNGRAQEITDFDLSWEPLSLAILVETSSRVESLLPEVRRSGILFTQLILGESGEAAVITFDSEVRLAQDFTSDADKIEKTLNSLKSGGNAVRMSDALARAVSLLQQRPPGRRKVAVVISEARDQGSGSSQGLVLRGAQQLGISMYAIGLSTFRAMLSKPLEGPSSPFPPGVAARPMPANQPPTPDAQSGAGAANVNLLEIVAELVRSTRSWIGVDPLSLYAAGTGGMHFSPKGAAELETALARIGRELHNQYLLTYRPNNLDGAGFHSIRVMVSRPSLQVRHRPGYMFTRTRFRGVPTEPPPAGQESGLSPR
ncbi:MAG: VWA domain-containing protein [Acidobacteria bacterium]|nr:VWA domain-containing protein [Acidobacteriota bacterium]